MEKKYVDYINEIDFEFVQKFAKEYCEIVFKSNKFKVQKVSDRWVVTCKIGLNNCALFHLLEFDFLNISKSNKIFGQKMWREALIEKFGKQYYSELCMTLREDLYIKQKTEQEKLNEQLESYKQALKNDERTK